MENRCCNDTASRWSMPHSFATTDILAQDCGILRGKKKGENSLAIGTVEFSPTQVRTEKNKTFWEGISPTSSCEECFLLPWAWTKLSLQKYWFYFFLIFFLSSSFLAQPVHWRCSQGILKEHPPQIISLLGLAWCRKMFKTQLCRVAVGEPGTGQWMKSKVCLSCGLSKCFKTAQSFLCIGEYADCDHSLWRSCLCSCM